jgi:hypothetical protein
MTSTLPATRAIAVAIRQLETGAVLGVALAVPSDRYFSFLAEGSDIATTADLAAETWREIDAWVTDSDRRLPAKPAPMSPSIVAAFLGQAPASSVSAERFASFPITAAHDELAPLCASVLPGLLNARKHPG